MTEKTLNEVWITEAKAHFESIQNRSDKTYATGDEISQKSKAIDQELKEFLKHRFSFVSDMELSLKGSKWAVQGQTQLNTGIWYRATWKKFGPNYPVVFGVALGVAGLDVSIQINNNSLGKQPELAKKLGAIIAEVLGSEGFDTQRRGDWNAEPYSDYGFFGQNSFDDDKFNKVLGAYKEAVYAINENLLGKVAIEFKKLFEADLKDIQHVSLSTDGDFYKKKVAIVTEFNKFLDNPIYENLEWWDSSINSAIMKGNRTNLVKNFDGLDKAALKPESKLPKVEEIFGRIKGLVFDGDGVKSGLTAQTLIDGVKDIDYMTSTAKELAYYLQMNADKIPLLNGASEKCIAHIATLTKWFNNLANDDIQAKINEIKDSLNIPEKFELPSYYVVDQFFNLLDKISIKELDSKQNTEHQDLYEYAYLFANLQGKAGKNGEKGLLDDLKKGKNLIYYGAPGTGKTYALRKNIEALVTDEDKQLAFVQFHPSYAYEDFIEGIKPDGIRDDGVLRLALKNGVFKTFCESAAQDEEAYLAAEKKEPGSGLKEYGYFFVADEINRAELSRVLGELLYCLEYRGKGGSIKTQYASLRADNPSFYIPENLFFIGTMNDVDRSIDSFDLALRRRFVWLRRECDYSVLKQELSEKCSNAEKYSKTCENLNKAIVNCGLDERYQLGHAYFLKIQQGANGEIKPKHLTELFDDHLDPLLREYLRSEYGDAEIKIHIKKLKDAFVLFFLSLNHEAI